MIYHIMKHIQNMVKNFYEIKNKERDKNILKNLFG